MNKLAGVKVGEYEIVDSVGKDDEYEYEETTVEELLNKSSYSEGDKIEFIKKYFAVNIHQFTSLESYDKIMELFKDYKTDKRLEKLNAVVLLSLKRKGRGVAYTPLAFDKFKGLVDYAFANGVPLGFDSCSCCKFQKCLDDEQMKKYGIMCEPCESALFSSFVNVDGKFFPCSFMDGVENWKDGIDVVNCEDFVKDVWMNERVVEWRNTLLAKKRECPIYEI